MTNPVIDRAMRAAFQAWKNEMLRTGRVTQIDAKFEQIAQKDKRLIELQCRAAIASLKGTDKLIAAGKKAFATPDYVDMDDLLNAFVNAALED